MATRRVGIRHAINGLLSLTPDGMPILGETPEVKGLWSVAAIWIKEAPGIARAVAEWMTHGTPEIDLHASDIARFYDHQKTRTHIEARSAEGFNKTYGIVHPMEQWASNRDVRLSPAYPRQRELGAVFFEAAGWERPFWYARQRVLLAEYGDRVMPRAAEWESRWWSPIINAEHLAMRDNVAMVDLAAFAIFDVTGPGALAYLQDLVVSQMDVPVGRVVYTPLLAETGGIVADLTIIRLAHDPFRVVDRRRDGDARPEVVHRSPARRTAPRSSTTRRRRCTRSGVWGPRARDLVAAATRDDVSNAGFPFGTARTIELGGVRALASRISYVGELGWEIYAPMEQGLRLWDTLWEAGQAVRRRRGRHRRLRRRPAGSRRAIGPTAPSSSWSSTSSRPAWPGRRSRTPTSSARRPTSASVPRRRPRSCARSRSTTRRRRAGVGATCSAASRS